MSQVLIRIKKSFPFPKDDLEIIKRRILHWANQRDILLFLDSNEYVHTQGRYECLCGVDALLAIEQDDAQLTGLKTEFSQQKDWLFGHFSYDFKNKLEKLSSHHTAKHHFPDLYFFRPQTVCYIHRGENVLWIETLDPADPQDVWNEIQDLEIQTSLPNNKPFVFEKRMQQEEYVSTIEKLKKHIVAGDCYEINFCNEAFCNKVNINPLPAFEKLNSISKAPFAAYYKLKRHALMCASPERYLYKNKAVITAQPIKGTAARSADREQDELQKDKLRNDTKERSENVMIVDLMRNDLARFCEPNSVIVEELFGIYTFPQVHQMISSISGKLRDDLSLFDAIRFSFPMGGNATLWLLAGSTKRMSPVFQM